METGTVPSESKKIVILCSTTNKGVIRKQVEDLSINICDWKFENKWNVEKTLKCEEFMDVTTCIIVPDIEMLCKDAPQISKLCSNEKCKNPLYEVSLPVILKDQLIKCLTMLKSFQSQLKGKLGKGCNVFVTPFFPSRFIYLDEYNKYHNISHQQTTASIIWKGTDLLHSSYIELKSFFTNLECEISKMVDSEMLRIFEAYCNLDIMPLEFISQEYFKDFSSKQFDNNYSQDYYWIFFMKNLISKASPCPVPKTLEQHKMQSALFDTEVQFKRIVVVGKQKYFPYLLQSNHLLYESNRLKFVDFDISTIQNDDTTSLFLKAAGYMEDSLWLLLVDHNVITTDVCTYFTCIDNNCSSQICGLYLPYHVEKEQEFIGTSLPRNITEKVELIFSFAENLSAKSKGVVTVMPFMKNSYIIPDDFKGKHILFHKIVKNSPLHTILLGSFDMWNKYYKIFRDKWALSMKALFTGKFLTTIMELVEEHIPSQEINKVNAAKYSETDSATHLVQMILQLFTQNAANEEVVVLKKYDQMYNKFTDKQRDAYSKFQRNFIDILDTDYDMFEAEPTFAPRYDFEFDKFVKAKKEKSVHLARHEMRKEFILHFKRSLKISRQMTVSKHRVKFMEECLRSKSVVKYQMKEHLPRDIGKKVDSHVVNLPSIAVNFQAIRKLLIFLKQQRKWDVNIERVLKAVDKYGLDTYEGMRLFSLHELPLRNLVLSHFPNFNYVKAMNRLLAMSVTFRQRQKHEMELLARCTINRKFFFLRHLIKNVTDAQGEEILNIATSLQYLQCMVKQVLLKVK